MRIILIKHGAPIGELIIQSDSSGGGLNGGVFFAPINTPTLWEKEIPLFEDYKIQE